MDNEKICYTGAFLGRPEAEEYRQLFFDEFQERVSNGSLIIIEDEIKGINHHWVVRILAQNPQLELDI